MRITLFSLIILIIFFGCTPEEPTLVEPESTPTLYFNGPIITMCGDEVMIEEALVEDAGQIVYVGSLSETREKAGLNATEYNLAGDTLLLHIPVIGIGDSGFIRITNL